MIPPTPLLVLLIIELEEEAGTSDDDVGGVTFWEEDRPVVGDSERDFKPPCRRWRPPLDSIILATTDEAELQELEEEETEEEEQGEEVEDNNR